MTKFRNIKPGDTIVCELKVDTVYEHGVICSTKYFQNDQIIDVKSKPWEPKIGEPCYLKSDRIQRERLSILAIDGDFSWVQRHSDDYHFTIKTICLEAPCR